MCVCGWLNEFLGFVVVACYDDNDYVAIKILKLIYQQPQIAKIRSLKI